MTVNRPYIIAINGGIGSGKSVVSRIVTAMGYPVYDCDARARQLMDSSDEIKAAISADIHRACIKDGLIDRAMLASIVFEDKEKLAILNSIVHGAVREHFASWAENQPGTVCFVETAILYQSGMDTMVDEVWTVDAPLDLRIERVMKRNGLTREAVMSRITTQDSYTPATPHPLVRLIINDADTPLLPRTRTTHLHPPHPLTTCFSHKPDIPHPSSIDWHCEYTCKSIANIQF